MLRLVVIHLLVVYDGLALTLVTTHTMLLIVLRLLHEQLMIRRVVQIGTGCFVMMLLVHTDLIELVIIKLVDLHLLNFTAWMHRRRPHGSIHTTPAWIITVAHAVQLIAFLILRIGSDAFAGSYIAASDR